MDKIAVGLIADLLYIKELINYEEYEAITDLRTAEDIPDLIEKMLRGELRGYRKGESYIDYARG